MADYSLIQGTFAYPGSTLSDTFYVPFTRTPTTAYLSGTYTLDSSNFGGNDVLVFRATDIFNGSTSFFFPQFELNSNNIPVWTAYDQRSNPFRLEWNSFSSGDAVRTEVWMTPSGSTTAVPVVVFGVTGTYITTLGTEAAAGVRTGAIFARETVSESPGYVGFVTDTDRKQLGEFYVNDDAMLSSTAVAGAFDGTSVGSLASGGFDKFIFNTVSGQSGLFGGNSVIEALEADIKIDTGALDSGRKYLNLAGSVGSPTANSRTNFTSLVPDVEYNLSVDLDSIAGITVRETDTGLRNWWDDVRYSDLGILADGKSGIVNNGSANPNSTSGVTLTTGNFTDTGTAMSVANVSSVNTAGTHFITLSAGHGFVVGDKLLFSENGNSGGQLSGGTRYVVTAVSGNDIKVANESTPTTNLTFFAGYTQPVGGTFQKASDYDVTVLRQTMGATDVYGGFESFQLTTGNDTINYNGGSNLSVNAVKGADTWNIAAKDSAGWSELRIAAGWSESSAQTTGVFVNLSGQSQSWAGVTLSGSSNMGQMRDSYGTIDTFNVSSGYGYADDVRLNFETSIFSDRLFLAADGMGTFAEYRIGASAGYDQYRFGSAVSPGTLATPPIVTSSNLSGLMGQFGNAYVEQATRFFDSSNYKISFAVTGTGGAQKLVATLYDTAQITNTAAGGDISVSDTSGWSVGDTVIYRAGANTVTGLTDGAQYTVSAVTGGTVRLLTTGATPVNPISSMDTTTSGSYLEHIVSTRGEVDGVYNSGVVNGGYVTFADDAGQFSRMAIRVDGKITDQTVLSFNANTNVQKFTSGQDFWTNDLASSQGHAAFSIDYGDLYDDQPSSVARTGILYVNGIVDKRALGFDRLVDYSESAYVGARSYSMTHYNDVMLQTSGSTSLELTLTAGAGEDKVFVEGVSSDVNQRIEINLGNDNWGSRDNQFDQVEIGVSKLAQKFGSVQYIDVTNADSSDLIKFVDADGYTLVKSSESGATAGTFKNYATYNIYQGANSVADSLVMQVRVTGDSNFWGSDQSTNLSLSNSSWGQITDSARTIIGNVSPVAMTANADSALLYEDLSTSPYLMGEGNDYVVTMGGDQDIGLGGGNDFLSIRNYGQQLFVSGGAGVDQLGMGGSFSVLSDGTYVSDQWSFSSIEVAKAKEFLAEKYPSLPTTSDAFAWDSGVLDRVMVATNRSDGTKVYFQAEELGFSNGVVNSGNFLPPISETYDTTAKSMAYTTLYGRSTNDTVNLKVADVDVALKHIGSWLNSTTLAPITTGNVLVGSHALEILAQPAAGVGPQWFSGSASVTNGGFKLVDVENIRLFDNAGKEVTVRVAGSSSYDSVDQAVQYANRGDVIFVAETKEGALTGVTRATVNMDTTVSVSGGLRVAFEEGVNRVVNTANQLVVNMTGSVKTSALDGSFFGTSSNALEVLGGANVNVNGSALSDLIVGNRGNNVINGLAGNDVIFGGNGSDMIIGSVGNDVLVGGSSHRIAASQHSPEDGLFSGFNLSTDAFRFNNASNFEFETGDKVIYKATGGTGISVAGTGVLTEASALFVIRGPVNADGSVDVRFANSVANAKLGIALDVTSNGTATTHGITIDNVAYAAANLAGSDYLYGGSGNDQLIATGVTASLSVAGVRDSLTMNGGSGNDTFSLFGNSGKINLFGGSGADKVEVFDNFLDVVGVNKSARMVDFAAAQDDILSTFDVADLGALSVEARLSNSGVALSQLVSPPLPIVSGSGENGNYQEMGGGTARSEMVEMDGYMLSIQDLINLHQAHAA